MYPDIFYELAMQFHQITEDYDQTICSYKNKHGIAIPCNAEERLKSHDFFKKVFNEICTKNKLPIEMFRRVLKETVYSFEQNYKK